MFFVILNQIYWMKKICYENQPTKKYLLRRTRSQGFSKMFCFKKDTPMEKVRSGLKNHNEITKCSSKETFLFVTENYGLDRPLRNKQVNQDQILEYEKLRKENDSQWCVRNSNKNGEKDSIVERVCAMYEIKRKSKSKKKNQKLERSPYDRNQRDEKESRKVFTEKKQKVQELQKANKIRKNLWEERLRDIQKNEEILKRERKGHEIQVQMYRNIINKFLEPKMSQSHLQTTSSEIKVEKESLLKKSYMESTSEGESDREGLGLIRRICPIKPFPHKNY